MNNIAFSAENADELNKNVQSMIAPHLFIICNYNPDSINTYSEDASFIKASLNMYKFLIDASICNNINQIGTKYGIHYDKNSFEEVLKVINAIRTTLGHNVNECNGTEEGQEILEQWFQNVVGKKRLSCADEYGKALMKILEYGNKCVSIFSQFIKETQAHPKKSEIIQDWERLIINYYKRSNSKKIFEGHLMIAYKAREANPSKNIRRLEMARWIKSMVGYTEKSQNSIFNEYLYKNPHSASDIKKIRDKIEDNERIINKKTQEIACSLGKEIDCLELLDYFDYYIQTIPLKIEKSLQDRKVKSLLPQDIVQEIIEVDFSNVPLP